MPIPAMANVAAASAQNRYEFQRDRKATSLFRNSTTKLKTTVRRRRVVQGSLGSSSSNATSATTNYADLGQLSRISATLQNNRPISGFSHWSEISSNPPTPEPSTTANELNLNRSLLSNRTGWSELSSAVPEIETIDEVIAPVTIAREQGAIKPLEIPKYIKEEREAPLARSDSLPHSFQESVAARDATVDQDFVLINCTGTKFEASKNVLQRYPQVLEGIFRDGIPRAQRSGRTEYFFDRDPELFRYVLLYCRYDEMHVPNHICGPLLEREMTAWGVPFGVDLQRCCFGHVMETKSQLDSLQRFEEAFRDEEETDSESDEPEEVVEAEIVPENCTEAAADPSQTPDERRKKISKISHMSRKFSKSNSVVQLWHKVRRVVWDVLDKPTSSIFAAMYALIIGGAVMLAVFVFVAGTNRYFQRSDSINNMTSLKAESTGSGSTFSTEVPTTRQHLHSPLRLEWLGYAEYVCIGIFTLDIIARLIFSRHKLIFLRNVYTLVDILSIIPFYFETIYHLYFPNPNHKSLMFIEAVGFLKITLVLRLMRIFRHYRGLQVLLYTLKTSLADLMLICVLLGLGTLIFATLIYFAEKDRSFKSIPHGFWWSLVTMTTVGYGDFVPETLWGYIIGVGCAMAGNVLITLTIPILVSHFMLYYSHSQIVIETQGLHDFVKEEFNTKLTSLRETLNLSTVQQRITPKLLEVIGSHKSTHPEGCCSAPERSALVSGLATVARTAVAMPEMVRRPPPEYKDQEETVVASETEETTVSPAPPLRTTSLTRPSKNKEESPSNKNSNSTARDSVFSTTFV